MAKLKILGQYKCSTVGDLYDVLSEILKDPNLESVFNSSIDSELEIFDGFKIIERFLSDKSTVLDFVLSNT